MRTAKIPKISPQFSHPSRPVCKSNVTQYIPAFLTMFTQSESSISNMGNIFGYPSNISSVMSKFGENKEIYAILFISIYLPSFGAFGGNNSPYYNIYITEKSAIKGPEEWPAQISKSQKNYTA